VEGKPHRAGMAAMFGVVSHLATLTISGGISHLRLLAIAIAILALPMQPMPTAASSSILIPLPATLTPIGPQCQGRFSHQWSVRPELGKNCHGVELSPLRRSRTALEPLPLVVRILPGIPSQPETPLAIALADRAPPSR
jgi:hypothetical protein